MQIARVVPKVLTQKEDVFDYAIPPELLVLIQPGVLVEIPFHGRKIEGIVLELKRKSQFSLNLKTIIKVIDPMPVIDATHIKLAQWMADYYLAPLSKTFFENIVPPAKRTIQKISQDFSTFFHGAEKVVQTTKIPQRYLFQADFRQRLEIYLKLIQETIEKNQTVIILVPDLSLIPFLTFKLKNPFSILHAGLGLTERWQEWHKIRQEKVNIIIGSNSALFAPVKNLGLIIIDQEESETYKNDRNPRFHAVKVAEKLSKLTAADLVLGTVTPRIETYYYGLKKIYLLKKIISPKQLPKITLVNMNSEHQSVSLPLQNKIEANLDQNKKIILVLNRKGEGIKFRCLDCGYIFNCPSCELPLTFLKDKLFCFRCQKEFEPLEKCPKCQNVHLKSFGLGTAKLEKFIQDFWPKAKIIRLEEKSPLKNIRTIPWDIAIATSYGLKFHFPQIGLVGIVDADQGLNFPDIQTTEKNFQNFFKFLKIGKQGIIQTHLENNPLIASLGQLNYEKFFLDELENRKKFEFPPFNQLIYLLYKNKADEKCREQSEEMYQSLVRIAEKSAARISIFGPQPAFFRKKHHYYRWQIIIKIKKGQEKETSILKKYLKTLPNSWMIDVDPIDLL